MAKIDAGTQKLIEQALAKELKRLPLDNLKSIDKLEAELKAVKAELAEARKFLAKVATETGDVKADLDRELMSLYKTVGANLKVSEANTQKQMKNYEDIVDILKFSDERYRELSKRLEKLEKQKG